MSEDDNDEIFVVSADVIAGETESILKQINAIDISIYYDSLEGHDVSLKTSVFWDVMLSVLVAD
jgi:hypothetical protein